MFMPAPVCLIENDYNGKLCVRKEAKDILDGIMEPVVVVSVVGLYRTGKSYLMNRLAGQQTGFALGSTIESKTKGIWMWCVPHPYKEGHTLVLLDTEGLGDVDKGDSKNDSWIFCLAVLLSSSLVYNSRGTIDNNALENLHYVTELAEQIKIRSPEAADEEEEEEEEDSKFVLFFPSFTWVVRDFTLELVIDGKKVTENEYLEFVLQLKKGVSKKVWDYNLPRQCIRNYFPSRECFVFPPPASPENMLHLGSLQEQDLVPDFLEATGRFCDYIFHKSAVKTLKGGHRVTGRLFGHLVEIYVDTISSGKVPCLDNAVVVLANLENQSAVQEALKVYQTGMEKLKKTFPVSVDDIFSEHKKFSSLAIAEFMKRSFKDEKTEHMKKLKENIDIHYLGLLQGNKMASEKKCRDLLKDLFSDMNKGLQDGEYSRPGGYELYCRHRDAIIEQYRREPDKGVSAEAVLNDFLNERGAEANSILYTDTKLTENDRKIQEEKEKAALLVQKCKEEEEKRIESERMMQAERERQEDQIRQIREKFSEELKQQQEEINKALDSKLKERESLLNKGFKEKADLMAEEIENLKKNKKGISSREAWHNLTTLFKGSEDPPQKGFQPAATCDDKQAASQTSDMSKVLEGAESASAQSSSVDAEMFTPGHVQEDQDKHKNTYRFVCAHAGQFQCSLTGLVFVMEGEGEVLYKTVSWNPRLLEGLGLMQPAGPLYDIACCNGLITGLHLPHCEIFTGEYEDSLAVAHFVGDNVEIIKPLQVTETHVMIDIKDLSIFGLIKRMLFRPSPVLAQVILFLRPITVRQKENILDVHLLPCNVPVPEVKHQHAESMHIKTSSKCSLTPGSDYCLCCEPMASTVQPETETFECNFGPNYHPTFEVFVDVNAEEVRLRLLSNTEGKEVWVRRILLTGKDDPTVQKRFTESEFVKKHRDDLILRVSSVKPIADSLLTQEMITDEMYSNIWVAEPRQEKMRLLLDALNSGGASVKAEFYRLLKEKERYLVDELESGPSGLQ